MAKLTKGDVLLAVGEAVSPFSAYINDKVQQRHARRIRSGGTGFPPTCALVLRRLRQLEADGLLECTGGPQGLYGYSWSITAAGRAALSATREDQP